MFREHAKRPSRGRRNFRATARKLSVTTWHNERVIYKGIVQKGSEYGSRLGFPTANIPLDDKVESGIFAANVTVGTHAYGAAVYADQRNKVLESHLFDFSGDLYGKEIEVELLEKLRDDRRFESEEEARRVIADDVQKAREYHRVH